MNVVSVKWGFGADTSKYNNSEYSIPDDGIIKLKVIFKKCTILTSAMPSWLHKLPFIHCR